MASTTSSTEERALALLGQGHGPELVAASVGVSVSRISQLLSDPDFSVQVAELRYKNLSAHSARDQKYDEIEDILLEKLKTSLGFLFKPAEISRILTQINAAKRRGSSSPEHLVNQQTVVQLNLPTQIIQHFTTNINNQVVRAGERDLITVQSSSMKDMLKKSVPALPNGTQNVQPSLPS